MDLDNTHMVVVKTQAAKDLLIDEWSWFGKIAVDGKPMGQGDAMVLRDSLLDAGFEWDKDFYLKKL